MSAIMIMGMSTAMVFAEDENDSMDTIGIVDCDAYTSHGGNTNPDWAMGENKDIQTDVQSAYVTLRFDKPMEIVDEEELKAEMMQSLKINVGMQQWVLTTNKMGKIESVSLSKDRKEFHFTWSEWVAPYSGNLISSGVWENLKTEDGTAIARPDLNIIIPNGLTTAIVDQTIADENQNAAVTVRVLNENEQSTRGMVHVLVLKNGQPATDNLSNFGASATTHWHNYLDYTPVEYVSDYSKVIQNSLGNEYIVTTKDDTFTITAVKSESGDVIDFHILSYLNNGTKAGNLFTDDLKAAIDEAKTYEADKYTAESYKTMTDAVAIAELIMKDPTYYAQADIDFAAARIGAVINTLVESGASTEEPSDPAKPEAPAGDNNAQTGNGTAAKTDKTVQSGDDFNMAIPFALAAVVIVGMAAAVVTRRKFN